MVALNKVKYPALIKVIVGVSNIIGIYYAAPYWGVIGVCTVTAIAFVISIVLSNIVYVKVLKLNIWEFFYKCHIKMLLGLFMSTLVAFAIRIVWPMNQSISKIWQWCALAAKGIIITILYLVIMWAFSWNLEEKKLMTGILNRRHA